MSRFSFFRQSGWMMIAGVWGGAFMYSVHVVLVKPVDQIPLGAITTFLKHFIHEPISKADYGLFNTFLSIVGIMSMPALALQTMFAQQTAAAVDETHERELRRTVRTILGVMAVIWLIGLLVMVVFQRRVLAGLSIAHPLALWITLITGLSILWMPIVSGLLQGRQNFLWLGFNSILQGFLRFLLVVVLVRMLQGGVTGAMWSVFLSFNLAMLFCFWLTRSDWWGASQSVPWGAWLRRVVPLTFGLGATTFMMSADMIVVRMLFPQEQTGFYSAAGIIGRAMVLFTQPLAAVMFPKIVRSAALSERTDVMAHALGATALLGGGAALFCTLFPALPLQIVYEKSYLVIKPLVPWFVWCMLPLTMANVLINNLLARQRFAVVGWLVIVVLSYGTTLLLVANNLVHREQLAAFRGIVQILGTFSTILLGVSIYFTWAKRFQQQA